MSKKTRGDKGEQKVIEVLQKEPKPFFLINNITFIDKNNLTHQIDHIFINTKGIYVIESKSLYGEIKWDPNDTIWTKTVRGKTININNPILQNRSHLKIVEQLLGNHLNIVPVVVFTLNNAPYLPNDNVINLNDLSMFVNEYPYVSEMPIDLMEKIYNFLLMREYDGSIEEHLKNIEKIKKQRRNNQDEIIKALETRRCPKCQNLIFEEKENYFRCTKCDFHFHF